MEQIKLYLRENYHLSNYQIAQIFFLFKTIASEISKIIIMGILFHNHLKPYLFGLCVMVILRSALGGLHFYTYISCLITSILYLWFAIYILPNITIIKLLQLMILLFCILLCYRVGPITSKYRPPECAQHFQRSTHFACSFIFIYALILYIMPEKQYLTIGFWVIILHSLQLLVAKIRKKGEHIK